MSHHDHKKSNHHHHDHDHSHSDDHDHKHDHGHNHKDEHSHDHTHQHTHDHEHSDGHEHKSHKDHGDHHDHTPSSLSFEDQLKTLFDHWVRHNDSHASSYKDWAKKARENRMPETAALLDDVAALTETVSKKIEEALKSIR